MFSVAESFVSINGEGTRAGELAVFIRFRGCNLRCSYCDTIWAADDSAAAKNLSADEIAGFVRNSGVKNVTLTGGEPLLQKEIRNLTDILISQGNRVEIETNGSLSLDELARSEKRPVFTMDYKLPSSGIEDKMNCENFAYLDRNDTVKFVSGSVQDLERAYEIICKYQLIGKCNIYFSPVFGKIEPEKIVEFIKEKKLNDVRLQLQLHKFIWNPDMRGV